MRIIPGPEQNVLQTTFEKGQQRNICCCITTVPETAERYRFLY